jgi:TorA maturation chaperone TorD
VTGAALEAFGLAFRYLGWTLYLDPAAAPTTRLAGTDAFDQWLLDPEEPDTRAGLERLRRFRAAWDGSAPDRLGDDYNRLFVGPGRLPAPPWESAWRGPERLLFGPHTLAVRDWYARFGLEAPQAGREPDDHLGLEFLFMAHLCDLAAGDWPASAAAWEAAAGFLDQHLLRWAPDCLAGLAAAAGTDYYQGVALLGLGSLAQARAHWDGCRNLDP